MWPPPDFLLFMVLVEVRGLVPELLLFVLLVNGAGVRLRGLPTRQVRGALICLRKSPTIAALAGVTAEVFGIGGGLAIVPSFITLSMQPKVDRPLALS